MPRKINSPGEPAARRAPMREEFQKIVNDSTVKVAEEGFAVIDKLTAAGIKHCTNNGIEGTGPVLERAALELKKLIAWGMTGRKQEQ